MVTRQKATGRSVSIPVGIAWGMLVGIGITVIGAAVLAWMMSGEKLSGDGLGYGIIVVLLVSSYVGALIASNKIKRLRVQMCILSGVVYYLSLVAVTALFFGGKYQGMGVTAIVVIIGCVSASITMLSGKKSNKPKIRKKGYR